MEARGDIDPGSLAKIRRESKPLTNSSYKAIQLLANTLSPAVSLDAFLPKSDSPGSKDLRSLTQRPVLICCADEERKQFLILIERITFFFNNRIGLTSPHWMMNTQAPGPSPMFAWPNSTCEGQVDTCPTVCHEAACFQKTRLSPSIKQRRKTGNSEVGTVGILGWAKTTTIFFDWLMDSFANFSYLKDCIPEIVFI